MLRRLPSKIRRRTARCGTTITTYHDYRDPATVPQFWLVLCVLCTTIQMESRWNPFEESGASTWARLLIKSPIVNWTLSILVAHFQFSILEHLDSSKFCLGDCACCLGLLSLSEQRWIEFLYPCNWYMPTRPCNVDILYAAACHIFAGYVRSCSANLDTPRVERTNISSGRTGGSYQNQIETPLWILLFWSALLWPCVSLFFLCGCLMFARLEVWVCVVLGRQERWLAFNKKRLKCQRYDPCLMQQRNACPWLSESCATGCPSNGPKREVVEALENNFEQNFKCTLQILLNISNFSNNESSSCPCAAPGLKTTKQR
jgi:hypothetical protein